MRRLCDVGRKVYVNSYAYVKWPKLESLGSWIDTALLDNDYFYFTKPATLNRYSFYRTGL